MKNHVSIITATYNSEEEIRSTYESIISQSFTNWEWIVTDDCSSDSTKSILKEIAENDSRVKYSVNEINSGAAISRNESLAKAGGEYIAFIDSDDLWLPRKLQSQIDFMNFGNVDFSFTAYELIDKRGNKIGKKVDSHQSGYFTYEDMLKKRATLGCSTVMIRRCAFSDISMPILRTGQDYATWLKLLKTGKKAYIINDILTQYRILPNSISRNKFKKALRQWQIYRDIEGLSFSYTLICFLNYAFRAVIRK